MIGDHLLTTLIFLPLLGALVMLFVPTDKTIIIRFVALGTMLLELLLTLLAVSSFDSSVIGYGSESLQLVEKMPWIDLSIGSFGSLLIQYFVAVDGLNITLVLLSGIILLIGVISSWNIQKQVKGYFILYMILSTSIMGCFLAIDMFLFFLFFEFMLLPMYFLIGIWGGKKRAYASIKFYIYTLVGSLLILIVMIGLSLSVVEVPGGNIHTFNIMKMMSPENYLSGSVLSLDYSGSFLGWDMRHLAFLLVFLGFAIKLPAVPVHTWLPDAHVEAPTPISVILAGVLLKIGGYGFYRIGYTIFPEAAQTMGWWIGLFGVIAIIYAAMIALAQSNLKRLIAYSSVSHMGFVMLGMASLTIEGNAGAILQLFSHGIISALLFILSGVLYDRTDNLRIADYSGLASKLPHFTVAMVIAFFAALGLPGFSGFIAEFLILAGAFDGAVHGSILDHFMPVLGLLGLVLGAAYFLWTLQKMFFGQYWVRDKQWKMSDLSVREYLMIVPLALMALLFGIFPGLILDLSNQTVIGFVEFVQQQGDVNLSILNK
ncbi:complex I subunit 4 family protein [Reichenbachiella versicolor]|uniref:complex I subunit 4 family protein n=1 Tax=Reichenbachiella versicolor TaxID=1821036 RepID=UPI000D6E56AC|nr:NADH-quinone oxidoreductase subunit M [Reichenbachiella versicolor]